MKVKICGITRIGDALEAVRLGADYIGVILYPKSPRYLPRERRTDILQVRGPLKVAVMVNPSLEEALSALEEGFDLIQLHGEESYEFAQDVGIHRVIKAFRVKDSLPTIEEVWKNVHGVLLDTYQKDSYGGTGKTFNWDLAKELVERGFRVFLSGGLRPDNVKEAIDKVRPYAVDVSSGVEISPGVKDHIKMKEFIREAKGS